MIKSKIKIDRLIDIVQDSNINFLFGSGMSMPYLGTLGSIEELLTSLEKDSMDEKNKKIIEASIYNEFFKKSIEKNINIFADDIESNKVLDYYKEFCSSINKLLLLRKNSLLGKQINIFTTNYDVFLEKSLEEKEFEYNDGFNGKFKPRYSISNFKKSIFKKSLYYENNSEIPIFNILKLHGSLTWNKVDEKTVVCDTTLKLLEDVKNVEGSFLDVNNNSKIDELKTKIGDISGYLHVNEFLEKYKKIMFVNPTKEKFEDTLMNQMYYDLLRIYSNELEKENTILFVMGFSFADEHIRDLTLRVVNSNPTLLIIIFAYSKSSGDAIKEKLDGKTNNENIIIFVPPRDEHDATNDAFKYDLEMINKKVFKPLLKKVEEDNE